MFPMRMSTIFKSRWWALIWAVGIIWFAYDFAGAAPDQDTNLANSASGDQDANKVAQVLGG